jgi:chaperonin GroES
VESANHHQSDKRVGIKFESSPLKFFQLWESTKVSSFKKSKISERSFLMATTIRPLNDRIIVRRVEDQEQMRGGLYIPDTAKEKPQEGKVIAVGNGKLLENGTRIPIDLKAGDRVLFGKYAGTEIKLDGEEYLILREDDVLGVIDDVAKGKAAK